MATVKHKRTTCTMPYSALNISNWLFLPAWFCKFDWFCKSSHQFYQGFADLSNFVNIYAIATYHYSIESLYKVDNPRRSTYLS